MSNALYSSSLAPPLQLIPSKRHRQITIVSSAVM